MLTGATVVCILKRCRDSYSNKVVATVVISVYYMCCHPQFSNVGSSSSSRALRTVMTPSGGGLPSGWWGRNRPAGASLQPPPAGTPDRSSRTKSPTFRGGNLLQIRLLSDFPPPLVVRRGHGAHIKRDVKCSMMELFQTITSKP